MSNKIPCGGFYLDDMLNVNDSGELSIKGGTPYQQLVTDGEGEAKWEDRLAYEYTEWKDFTITDDATVITGFSMPPVGDTVTVKVNGVESVETVKSGESDGILYSYIGSTDLAGLMSGTNGWLVLYLAVSDVVEGLANPETTVSLPITEQHKIDNKFIEQDTAFIRQLKYYIGLVGETKTYYKESGEKITTYICTGLTIPDSEQILASDFSTLGLLKVGSLNDGAFFVGGFGYNNLTDSVIELKYIFGDNESSIAELASNYGYTLTTKPTT